MRPVGYISYTHGLDGKVKIVPIVSASEFEKFINGEVFIKSCDTKVESGGFEKIEISIFAFTGKVFLCRIRGINDIDEAKKFLKKEIFANNTQNDYIDGEKIIGFEVFKNSFGNQKYGVVVDSGNYGSGELIEVEPSDKKTNKQSKNMQNAFFFCDNRHILEVDYENKKLVVKCDEN